MRYGIAYLVTQSTLLPLEVLIYPLVVLVSPFVCLLVVLVCPLVVFVCPVVYATRLAIRMSTRSTRRTVRLFITDPS